MNAKESVFNQSLKPFLIGLSGIIIIVVVGLIMITLYLADIPLEILGPILLGLMGILTLTVSIFLLKSFIYSVKGIKRKQYICWFLAVPSFAILTFSIGSLVFLVVRSI